MAPTSMVGGLAQRPSGVCWRVRSRSAGTKSGLTMPISSALYHLPVDGRLRNERKLKEIKETSWPGALGW